jgi:hypothetical protein
MGKLLHMLVDMQKSEAIDSVNRFVLVQLRDGCFAFATLVL